MLFTKNIINVKSITEAGRYLAEISEYDKEMFSLTSLIIGEEADKIKQRSICPDNISIVTPNNNYTSKIIELSDELKEFGIKNIDILNTTKEKFLQNEDAIIISLESSADFLVQILYLSSVAGSL